MFEYSFFLFLLPFILIWMLMALNWRMKEERRRATFKIKNMKEPVHVYVEIQNNEFLKDFEKTLKGMLGEGFILSYGYKSP